MESFVDGAPFFCKFFFSKLVEVLAVENDYEKGQKDQANRNYERGKVVCYFKETLCTPESIHVRPIKEAYE